LFDGSDVFGSILPTIGVPTLVVHGGGDAIVPLEHGRYPPSTSGRPLPRAPG
jgi:pimeloyl-ACP methyl ester carboxylesterase